MTALALAAAACGGPDAAIVVEVQGRPAVQAITSLEVTVSNEGATQTETFDLSDVALPATFSITAAGRTGLIGITGRALDGALPRAHGATSVDAGASAATLILDPDDFVVNTEFAGGQFLNQDPETNGFQLAVGGGVITVGFRDDCPVSACNLLGRRFGLDGRPVSTDLGAGTNQYRWNQIDGAFVAHVGVASQDDGSAVALWDTPSGVECRSMTATGMGDPSGETSISVDMGADVVSAVPFADGNYGVAWTAFDINMVRVIRTVAISPDCTTRFAPLIAAGPVSYAHRPTYALTPRATVVAWIDNFEARFRIGTYQGVFVPSGTAQTGATLVAVPAPDGVDFVRVIGVGDGFVVVYRRSGPGPDDSILMRRIDEAGTVRGNDTVIATFPRDFGAPAVALRGDGAIAVAWTQCNAADGSDCSIHARLVRPSGVPVGDGFVVNTTTRANQLDPSIAAISGGFVVAFSDYSADAPDISESSVRMRYIYPPFDDARATIGARCATTPECGAGLVCAADALNLDVCHAACTPGGPCPGGGACTTQAGATYCVY